MISCERSVNDCHWLTLDKSSRGTVPAALGRESTACPALLGALSSLVFCAYQMVLCCVVGPGLPLHPPFGDGFMEEGWAG